MHWTLRKLVHPPKDYAELYECGRSEIPIGPSEELVHHSENNNPFPPSSCPRSFSSFRRSQSVPRRFRDTLSTPEDGGNPRRSSSSVSANSSSLLSRSTSLLSRSSSLLSRSSSLLSRSSSLLSRSSSSASASDYEAQRPNFRTSHLPDHNGRRTVRSGTLHSIAEPDTAPTVPDRAYPPRTTRPRANMSRTNPLMRQNHPAV